MNLQGSFLLSVHRTLVRTRSTAFRLFYDFSNILKTVERLRTKTRCTIEINL